MHKDSKWAKEIISLQNKEGAWGYFHTLSEPNKNPVTTEQALRRLEILGYTIEDDCIQKSVEYMVKCLERKIEIPDRREKTHNWDIFTDLILSTWIRRFTKDISIANKIADIWASIITSAFSNDFYSNQEYVLACNQAFSQKVWGDRLMDFVNFYHVSLISDCLDVKTEKLVFDYILNYENGIYYMSIDKAACELPEVFESKNASRFLRVTELLTEYKNNLYKLDYVVDWLNKHRNQDGKWDMGASSKDNISFPLSDSWRSKENRVNDCTYRINKLLNKIV